MPSVQEDSLTEMDGILEKKKPENEEEYCIGVVSKTHSFLQREENQASK